MIPIKHSCNIGTLSSCTGWEWQPFLSRTDVRAYDVRGDYGGLDPYLRVHRLATIIRLMAFHGITTRHTPCHSLGSGVGGMCRGNSSAVVVPHPFTHAGIIRMYCSSREFRNDDSNKVMSTRIPVPVGAGVHFGAGKDQDSLTGKPISLNVGVCFTWSQETRKGYLICDCCRVTRGQLA